MTNVIPLMRAENEEDSMVKTTAFTHMTDLLNYLNYKNFDLYFQFNFLEESRFILDHELILAEFAVEFSLDFMVTATSQIYILHNHHQFHIDSLVSEHSKSKAYLLPTT